MPSMIRLAALSMVLSVPVAGFAAVDSANSYVGAKVFFVSWETSTRSPLTADMVRTQSDATTVVSDPGAVAALVDAMDAGTPATGERVPENLRVVIDFVRHDGAKMTCVADYFAVRCGNGQSAEVTDSLRSRFSALTAPTD